MYKFTLILIFSFFISGCFFNKTTMANNTIVKDLEPSYIKNSLIYENKFGGKDKFAFFDNSISDGQTDTRINSIQNGSENYTLSVWANSNGKQSTAYRKRQQVISADEGGYDWSIGMDNGYWCLFDGNTYKNTQLVKYNNWQHLVAVFDSNLREYRFYIDGKLYIHGKLTRKHFDINTNNFYIGENPSSKWSEHFNGKIANVKIFNYPLTDSSITSIYKSEKNLYKN